MSIDTNFFLGVDTSGGRRTFTFASIDHNAKLLMLDAGELGDVIAFLNAYPGALVVVNSPQGLSRGLLRQENIRNQLPPLHVSGRSLDMRLAEHLLRERGINVPLTPARKELCSNWILAGFSLYQAIKSLNSQPQQLNNAQYQWLETNAHACFCALLGHNPMSRSLVEGRLQRQLVLHEQGLMIRDPMDFFEEITRYKLLRGALPLQQIYSPEELDALASAFVGFSLFKHPEQKLTIGDVDEGQITLPVSELKEKY